jgi:hypothetical protein
MRNFFSFIISALSVSSKISRDSLFKPFYLGRFPWGSERVHAKRIRGPDRSSKGVAESNLENNIYFEEEKKDADPDLNP